MLLFINEIDFNAFGPFNEVDGTDVKLFRAMFKSYGIKREKIPAFQLMKLKYLDFEMAKNRLHLYNSIMKNLVVKLEPNSSSQRGKKVMCMIHDSCVKLGTYIECSQKYDILSWQTFCKISI